MNVGVRQATLDEIVPLRLAVLRPGRPREAAVFAGDDRAVHVGAWDGDVLVGCASVLPDPWPDEPLAWRLRGMAVEPSRQGRGVGRQVLSAAVDVARAAGAPLLWANARTSALPFYEAMGWTVVGSEFRTQETGLPHKRITLRLTSA